MSEFVFPSPDQPEFFRSRGIGSDGGLPCLVTGRILGFCPNISGFPRGLAGAHRVIAMLGGRAKLAYRHHEPNYIQVKIGVSEEHTDVLTRLHRGITFLDGIITPKIIDYALHRGPPPFPISVIEGMSAEIDALKRLHAEAV